MKKYQMIIMFVPSATEEIIDKTLAKIQEKIPMSNIEKKGLQKMAYEEVQQKTRIKYKVGYYVSGKVAAEEDTLRRLGMNLSQDENIIKHTLVRTER